MIKQQLRPKINSEDWGKPWEEDTHHILATSVWGTNHRDNRIELYKDLHSAYHRVFGTLDIQNQIKQLFLINQTALSKDFSIDLMKCLAEDDPVYYYKTHILKNK